MQPSTSTVPPHYECLGVSPSISAADLARHYKKLSLQLHPDRAFYRDDAANEAHIQARYQRITEAYAVLSDPEKRNAYDTRHGVNFQSRVMRLQAAIGQHNTSALQRSTTASAAVELPSSAAKAGRDDTDQKEEEEDDDDDEYDPNEVAVPSRGGLAKPSTHPPHVALAKRTAAGVHNSGESEDEDMSHLFSLQAHYGDAAGQQLSHDGSPEAHCRGVTLRRPCTYTATAAAVTPFYSRTWGLRFEEHVLVGLDDEYPELLHDIAGLAAVPFPAVVQQVNDIMVMPRADVGRLVWTASPSSSPRERDEDLDRASSDVPEVEELQLTLSYTACCFDLVGDLHLLSDEAVLQRLVPAWCIAPQIGTLAADAVVLSVNGAAVRSAEELRAALRAAVQESGEVPVDGTQAVKRSRTSPAVIVELCQLPFL